MKKRIIITTLIALTLALGIFAYIKIRTITIKFMYNNDSTIASNSVKIKPNSTVSLITIEREGYIFQGWYCNDELVTKDTIFKKSSVLEAKWLKKYVVTYEYSPSKTESVDYVEGDAIKLIEGSLKEGYTFMGWYDYFENKVEDGTILEPKDITLYAKYIRND